MTCLFDGLVALKVSISWTGRMAHWVRVLATQVWEPEFESPEHMQKVRHGYVCGFPTTSIALGGRPCLKKIRVKVTEQGTMSSSGLSAGVCSSGHEHMHRHIHVHTPGSWCSLLEVLVTLPARSPSSWLKAFWLLLGSDWKSKMLCISALSSFPTTLPGKSSNLSPDIYQGFDSYPPQLPRLLLPYCLGHHPGSGTSTVASKGLPGSTLYILALVSIPQPESLWGNVA